MHQSAQQMSVEITKTLTSNYLLHLPVGDPDTMKYLEHVPTWVFHGTDDDVVPFKASEMMVEALLACGGDVKFTIYPEVKHDAWTETYDNPELYEWFLQHSTSNR